MKQKSGPWAGKLPRGDDRNLPCLQGRGAGVYMLSVGAERCESGSGKAVLEIRNEQAVGIETWRLKRDFITNVVGPEVALEDV